MKNIIYLILFPFEREPTQSFALINETINYDETLEIQHLCTPLI